jgi:hypothetical protein
MSAVVAAAAALLVASAVYLLTALDGDTPTERAAPAAAQADRELRAVLDQSERLTRGGRLAEAAAVLRALLEEVSSDEQRSVLEARLQQGRSWRRDCSSCRTWRTQPPAR